MDADALHEAPTPSLLTTTQQNRLIRRLEADVTAAARMRLKIPAPPLTAAQRNRLLRRLESDLAAAHLAREARAQMAKDVLKVPFGCRWSH